VLRRALGRAGLSAAHHSHLVLDDMRQGLNQLTFQPARATEAPELASALAAGGEPPLLAARLLV
jgi:hypothetical protein